MRKILSVYLMPDEELYLRECAKKAGLGLSQLARRLMGFENPMPDLRGGIRAGQGRPRKVRPEQGALFEGKAKPKKSDVDEPGPPAATSADVPELGETGT